MSDSLLQLFSDVLEVSFDKLNDETSPKNTPQWDSLTAMHLVAAIEAQFNVYFNSKEIETLDSIGRIRKALKDKNATV